MAQCGRAAIPSLAMSPAGRFCFYKWVTRSVTWVLVLAMAGCSSDRRLLDGEVPLDVVTDRSMEAWVGDTGRDAMPDAAMDARRDATTTDGPTWDTTEDVRSDGAVLGRCTPVIDGRIGADWPSTAIVERNTAAHTWINNELRVLRVCYDATSLYLGIEGTVEMNGNGIVVYLDRDFRGGPGGSATGISRFEELTDDTGQLDNIISAALTLGSGAMGFGADGAWGTAGMRSLAGEELSDATGLRLFAPAPGASPDAGGIDRRRDFAWVTGAQSVCNASGSIEVHACEVAIRWNALFEGPRPARTTVALFARIHNHDGTMSASETLPQDNPKMPRRVDRVLVMEVGP